MSNRQLLVFLVVMITADNLGEMVAAHWPCPSEVELNEQHRRMLAEIRAKLEEVRR